MARSELGPLGDRRAGCVLAVHHRRRGGDGVGGADVGAVSNRDIAPREPTSVECTGRARVGEHATAFWFPQMGGYTARAVAVVDPDDCCIDVWVWHNGEFPFTGESCLGCGIPHSPMRIHATQGF